MDISLALLTTHAWAASQRLIYNGINTYNMDQSLQYKGRKLGEAFVIFSGFVGVGGCGFVGVLCFVGVCVVLCLCCVVFVCVLCLCYFVLCLCCVVW